MKRYFVTQLSIRDNLWTLNWRLQLLDDKIPEDYLERAHRELFDDTEFVTQHELYKAVKRKTGGEDTEIILSYAVKMLLKEIKDDFPKATVWVYEL
jgi:hypothetical protein